MTFAQSIVKLNKVIEEQATLISAQQAQIRELNKLVDVEPIEAYECFVPPHITFKTKGYKKESLKVMKKVLSEMNKLIEVCTNSSTNRYQKDKAKDRLLWLDNLKVDNRLKL